MKNLTRFGEQHEVSEQLLESICRVLSDQVDQVDWLAFTPELWDLWVELAKQEGVAPLLYLKFKRNSWPDEIPIITVARLMQEYNHSLAYNKSLLYATDLTLDILQQNEIPTILLKGAVFSRTIYPDLALRPMTDIDLLVHYEDLDKAVHVLKTVGFIEPYQDFHRDFLKDVWHNFHLINKDHVSLELHWSLISGEKDWRTPSADWVWGNTELVDFLTPQRSHIYCLNPTAALLYMSAHIAIQHGLVFSRLIWLYDIHLFMLTYAGKIDLIDITHQALELNWASALYTTLETVQRRFCTPIPQQVLDELQRIGIKDFDLVRRKSTLDLHYERIVADLSSLNWTSRIKVILAGLFPSPAFMYYHYPVKRVWLLPFSYLHRWFVIASNVFMLIFKRIRNI